MQIILNGEKMDLAENISFSGLIEKYQLDVKKIAIERNLEIVPQSEYNETLLCEGDEVEIIHFIGGG